MANYIDYISEQRERILAMNEDSKPVRLSEIYKDVNKILSIGGPDYQRIAKKLSEEELTRSKVRASFKYEDKKDRGEALYTGFVAVMLWGGLGSDGKTFGHLEKAMSQDNKKDVVEKLLRVKDLLDDGKIADAFGSMCPRQENKILGIDVSYFTKLLFFMNNAGDGSNPFPLIYDNWGWRIHAALLISKGQTADLTKYFIVRADLKKDGETIKILPFVILQDSRTRRIKAYQNYIHLMWEQSRSLSESLFPGDLEQFLFGRPRKGEDAASLDNPRNILLPYIRQGLAELFRTVEVDTVSDDADNTGEEKHHEPYDEAAAKAKTILTDERTH